MPKDPDASKGDTTIVVNGREVPVDEKELTYEEVIKFAYPSPDPNALFTVTYRRGRGEKPEGSLVAGQTLKVKEGMVINVTITGRS